MRQDSAGANSAGYPVPGERLGGYQIERELSSGQKNLVYLARDEKGAPVAIKLPRALPSPAQRERFRREVELRQRLEHPGIVSLIRAELDADLPFCVLEYVEGVPLTRLLSRGVTPLPVAEAAKILTQVAQALAHAHEREVLHRDLRPANVLVHEGRAWLAGFGSACRIQGTRTTVRGLAGTPPYMAPEQLRDGLSSTASDVWALGTLAYECLAGDRPFRGERPLDLHREITSQEVPLLPRRVAGDGFRNLLQVALSKIPERRPSASLVALRLEDLSEEHSTATRLPATNFLALGVV